MLMFDPSLRKGTFIFSSMTLCIGMLCGGTACNGTLPPGSGQNAMRQAGNEIIYTATVPDTLDLSERAEMALNGLAGTLDPKSGYEIYLRANFGVNPPYMYHETTGLPTNNPKYAESFPMMRVMSGSDKFNDIQNGMMKSMLSFIAADGLYYAPASKARSWHEGAGHNYGTRTGEDFANVYGNSRMLLAMMAWMQYDPNGPWLERAKGIARGLCRIAVKKDDYAYYPDSRVGEAFSYPKSGWPNTDEPLAEGTGAEGSMFMYYCGPIRALARWYEFTGDKEALDAAGKLVRFVTRRKFWGVRGLPEDIDSSGRAYFVGHMHGHTAMLYALAEYAAVTKDASLLNFVRDGYDFARHHGFPEIGGWLNTQPDVEVCSISDMIAIAIKLTESGLGDYYDDVDAAVRNQLAESQLLRPDYIKEISARGQSHKAVELQETGDRVIERSAGIMMPLPFNGYKVPYMINCCNGNGTQALFYAWSKIVDRQPGLTRVNLLLNRFSPWADVSSHLPHEGKVVILNKVRQQVSVRIPGWVDRNKVKASVKGKEAACAWIGNYMLLPEIPAGQEIDVTFPISEKVVTRYHKGTEYRGVFRGSMLVDIEPKVDKPGYPIYERAAMRSNLAPIKTVKAYIPAKTIKW